MNKTIRMYAVRSMPALAFAGAAAIGAAATALGAAQDPLAAQQSAAPAVNEGVCSGGGEGDVSIAFAAENGRVDLANLRLLTTHKADDAATVGTLFEVLDPHNRPVRESQFAAPARVGRGIVQTRSLALPKDLADGYYLLRASAAVGVADKASAAVALQAIRVASGTAVLVSQEEFYTKSGANNGIAL